MSDPENNFIDPQGNPQRGVHDPSFFHDGCGVACVARLDGRAIHETIDRGLVALDRLEHRGATGADASTGDGAGIMIGLPHEFFRLRATEIDSSARGAAAPRPARRRDVLPAARLRQPRRAQNRIAELVTEAGHTPIGWREVPVDETSAGEMARASAPQVRQLFIAAGEGAADEAEFERQLFVIRRRAEQRARPRRSRSRACPAGPSSTREC